MNHKRSLHLLPELCDSLRWIATFADKSSFIYFVCCVRAQDYSSGRLLIAMTHDTRRFLARAVHTAVTTCPPFLLAVMIACRLLLGFEPLQYETNVTATAAVSLSLSKRFMGVLGVLHFFFEYWLFYLGSYLLVYYHGTGVLYRCTYRYAVLFWCPVRTGMLFCSGACCGSTYSSQQYVRVAVPVYFEVYVALLLAMVRLGFFCPAVFF